MLRDIVPNEYRRALYEIVSFAALVFSVWQGAEGNWELFVGSLLTALTTRLAASNTGAPREGRVDEFDGLDLPEDAVE